MSRASESIVNTVRDSLPLPCLASLSSLARRCFDFVFLTFKTHYFVRHLVELSLSFLLTSLHFTILFLFYYFFAYSFHLLTLFSVVNFSSFLFCIIYSHFLMPVFYIFSPLVFLLLLTRLQVCFLLLTFA